MKIALVHDFLTKMGGAEKVLMSMMNVFPDAPIFTLLYDENGTRKVFSKKQIFTSSLQNYPVLNKRPKYLISKFPKAIEEFDLSEFDVVISSSNSFAHGILTNPATLHLCYCHSPMRYVWDWYHNYLSENKIGMGIKGLYVRSILHSVRIWDKVASSRVDHWLANSKNVSKRIQKYYRLKSEVLYPPVDINAIQCSENLPDDYYLVVSRLEPYKKVDLAIAAFKKLGKHLVIIGEGSMEKALKNSLPRNVEMIGWQSDKSIYEYMRNAKAFIFPADDDFGITPVESMAAGRPVIAFKKGGVMETVLENKTGVFFANQTVQDLIHAVDNLEADYQRFSPKECRKQSEMFSKEIFENKLKKIVEVEYNKFINKHFQCE